MMAAYESVTKAIISLIPEAAAAKEDDEDEIMEFFPEGDS